MPEQKKQFCFIRTFCSGVLAFILAALSFSECYRGSFVALYPFFLLFLIQFLIGGCAGRLIPLPQKIFWRILLLLIFVGNPDRYGFPLPEFINFNALLCGIAAVWAFQGVVSKEVLMKSGRYFFAGGAVALLLTVLLSLTGTFWYNCIYLSSVFLFMWGCLYEKVERKKNWNIASAIFLFAVFFAVFFFNQERYRLPDPVESVQPSLLKQDLILSLAHGPVRQVLLVLPPESKMAAWSLTDPERFNVIRFSRGGGALFPRSEIRKDSGIYDLAVVEVPENVYSLITREFVRELKERLRPGGVVVFLTEKKLYPLIHSSLSTSFTKILSMDRLNLTAASDLPLKPVFPTDSMLNALEYFLFSGENEASASSEKWNLSRRLTEETIPSDRNFRQESILACESGSDDSIFCRWYKTCCQWNFRLFRLTALAGVIFFMIFRYFSAYYPGAGLRFSLFRDSFLGFLTLIFLLCNRSFSDEILIACGVFLFCSGAVFSERFCWKKERLNKYLFLILLLLSWLMISEMSLICLIFCGILSFLSGVLLSGAWKSTLDHYSQPEQKKMDHLIFSIYPGLLAAFVFAVLLIPVPGFF